MVVEPNFAQLPTEAPRPKGFTVARTITDQPGAPGVPDLATTVDGPAQPMHCPPCTSPYRCPCQCIAQGLSSCSLSYGNLLRPYLDEQLERARSSVDLHPFHTLVRNSVCPPPSPHTQHQLLGAMIL